MQGSVGDVCIRPVDAGHHPLGGVAADQYPKRLVLLLAVRAFMVSSLAIGIAVIADVIEDWMLLGLGGVQAAAFALYLPARR